MGPNRNYTKRSGSDSYITSKTPFWIEGFTAGIGWERMGVTQGQTGVTLMCNGVIFRNQSNVDTIFFTKTGLTGGTSVTFGFPCFPLGELYYPSTDFYKIACLGSRLGITFSAMIL